MRPPRRHFLRLVAGAAALPAVSPFAQAQTYPSRPVRFVVGAPPGGGTDIIARLMGQWLSRRLGQPFIIDNRPGAGTNIATEAVVNAAPDGYALLLVAPASAINATLYDKLSFNFVRDIAPVASMVRQPLVMLVNPSIPANTVREFIAYAKANPGNVNMASSGTGTTPHLAGELLKTAAGITMQHVPYRGGGAALTDLIGGRVHICFASMHETIEYIKVGKVRPLAVTTATRAEALPDIPALSEFVPGFEVSAWSGVGAPRNTPTEIVDRLNKEINAALSDPETKSRLAGLGLAVLAGSPADFGKLIVDETEKWGKVIRAGNIKLD